MGWWNCCCDIVSSSYVSSSRPSSSNPSSSNPSSNVSSSDLSTSSSVSSSSSSKPSSSSSNPSASSSSNPSSNSSDPSSSSSDDFNVGCCLDNVPFFFPGTPAGIIQQEFCFNDLDLLTCECTYESDGTKWVLISANCL